jgi:hypothetical protein
MDAQNGDGVRHQPPALPGLMTPDLNRGQGSFFMTEEV